VLEGSSPTSARRLYLLTFPPLNEIRAHSSIEKKKSTCCAAQKLLDLVCLQVGVVNMTPLFRRYERQYFL